MSDECTALGCDPRAVELCDDVEMTPTPGGSAGSFDLCAGHPLGECSTVQDLVADVVLSPAEDQMKGDAGPSESPAGHPLGSNSDFESAGSFGNAAVHSTTDRNPGISLNDMLERLSGCKNLADCGVWLAWGLKNQLLTLKEECAGPLRNADRNRSGVLFPLPVKFPDLVPASPADPAASGGISFATECWLAVACTAINAYYGCPKDGTLRKPGKVHIAALSALRDKIQRFLEGEVPHDLNFIDVVSDLQSKRVSYSGEEISQPCPLTMEQIERGLRPLGHGGSVDLLQFLTGVMQQLSRQVLLQRGLSPKLELRKGKPLPVWFAQAVKEATVEKSWWQVYLDNFMAAELGGDQQPGGDVKLQEAAALAWGAAGILTAEDKQVLGSPQVTELGVRLDGSRGLLWASPERILETVWASVFFLQKDRWDKKLCQIILGRWIFILQFRRAAMGILSRSWETIECSWPKPSMIQRVHREVLTLLCLAPLLQCDMRAPYDSKVTCSDASESGGAAAISNNLTWSGQSLLSSLNNHLARPIEVPVLLISIFNGLGACFRIYDLLGLLVAGRIAVDISKTGNRVTRSTWPSTLELHDIQDINKEDVKAWANAYPRIQEVHVMAGFPCIHLSSVRAYRQNLSGEGSRLFWDLLTLLGWIHEIFGSYCVVKHVIENVASMDETARKQISAELDIIPIKLDPADCLDYSRPRLAWCSVELYAMEGIRLVPEKDYVRAYVTAPNIPVASWIRPGWTWDGQDKNLKFPTFMKSIKRDRPPPAPAGYHRASYDTLQRWRDDQYRFPPYQYASQFMVSHPTKGLRPLDASERELLMGFGAGHTATCMSASDAKRSFTAYEDARKSLCGDSFSILSFGVIAAQLCAKLVPRMTPEQIVMRMGLAPGACVHPSVQAPVTRWLNYGPILPARENDASDLVRHLGLTVNHTGADVRVVTQAERRRRRRGIRLRDFSITSKTRLRYEAAVGRILPFLDAQRDWSNLDSVLCDYIELQWSRGESLYFIADGLSGLHFFMPDLRGLLRNSWRLFKDWRRIEAPARAPPITVPLVRAIVARAVRLNEISFACMISLGFHTLLRTGEMLQVACKDLEISSQGGVLSLPQTKSGLRSGTFEAVAIRDHLTLQLLDTWKVVSNPSLGDKLWPFSAQRFRDTFRRYLRFFRVMHLELKPYSLRRGGATHLLQVSSRPTTPGAGGDGRSKPGLSKAVPTLSLTSNLEVPDGSSAALSPSFGSPAGPGQDRLREVADVHSPGAAAASRNPFEGLNPFEGSEASGSNPFSESSADAAAADSAGAGDRGSMEKFNPFSSGSVKALEVGGRETGRGSNPFMDAESELGGTDRK
eukprot:s3415_g6.t1